MNVALIVPKSLIVSADRFDEMQWDKMWEYQARKRLWSCPDLSLLTVAGMMPDTFHIDYIDLNHINPTNDHYDMAFFSPSTSQIVASYQLADILRNNGTLVVMGGVHVSVLPQEALLHADVVFIGEVEDIFNKFVNDYMVGKIERIYKAENKPDINKAPIPRYDLIKSYNYYSIPIQTSRGCPHQCEFCLSTKLYGKKCRRKSILQVEQELKNIKKLWNNPFIFFTDDNIFINKKHSMELIDLFIDYGIHWYAFSDARISDQPDLLKKISQSGCRQLLIGFESLYEDNLKQINKSGWKSNKKAQYEKIVEHIQSYGIGVVGSFVLGLHYDTPAVFDDIFDFIIKTKMYATNITVLTPFPGTKLYDQMTSQGRLITRNWDKYNGFELTYNLSNMDMREFYLKLDKFYRKLNSPERIASVLNNFKKIINFKAA